MSGKMVAPELFRPPVDFPDVPYDHLLRMAAYRNPDRPAIIYHDLILTYREVVSMVNSIANGLLNLGLTKGDRLCLFTLNRPEYTITFIAAGSIGVVVDRKSTRLNSSHGYISYAVFCLKKKNQ